MPNSVFLTRCSGLYLSKWSKGNSSHTAFALAWHCDNTVTIKYICLSAPCHSSEDLTVSNHNLTHHYIRSLAVFVVPWALDNLTFKFDFTLIFCLSCKAVVLSATLFQITVSAWLHLPTSYLSLLSVQIILDSFLGGKRKAAAPKPSTLKWMTHMPSRNQNVSWFPSLWTLSLQALHQQWSKPAATCRN